MNSCEFVTFISILACDIAERKSAEEIAIIASFLTQLGDTLTTIAAFESYTNIHTKNT